MRERRQYGDKNLIGKNIYRLRMARHMKQHELLAQLQVRGIDISPTSLSDLIGQNRSASDKEIIALMDIFHVSFETLIGKEES